MQSEDMSVVLDYHMNVLKYNVLESEPENLMRAHEEYNMFRNFVETLSMIGRT